MAKEKATDALGTLMIAQALGGSGSTDDPEVKELLKFYLREQIEKMKERKARDESHRKAAIQQTKDIIARRENLRRGCNHRKPYPLHSTRLAGQHLGNGQTLFVCSRCHSEFFNPPDKTKGQIGVPAGLWPNPDHVGGPMGYAILR